MEGRRLEEKKAMPNKKKLLIAALVLCISVMLASLAYIGYWIHQNIVQSNTHKEISGLFNSVERPALPIPSFIGNPDDASPDDDPEASPLPVQPLSEREIAILMDEQGRELYKDILDINQYFRGRISIPGLGLEEYYIQYTDHDYYLRRDFYGNYHMAGTVFMHADNDPLLLDPNTVLFGHNMQNGTMFAPLHQYKKEEGFLNAPVIILDDLTGTSVYIVFAAYVCEPDYGYIEPKPNKEEFAELLEEIQARNWFITDVDVNENDRILTLSTCSKEHEDVRLAVHARKLRPGEEIPTEVIAVKNPNPKPYTIPRYTKLSDVKASQISVMQHPRTLQTHLFQVRENGIDRYSGNTTDLQGAFPSYEGKMLADSYLSSIYYTVDSKVYIAVSRSNGTIDLLSSTVATGTMRLLSAVSPPGVTAKYPLLAVENDELWLLYTVSGTDGESLYKQRLVAGAAEGEPELLVTTSAGSGTRPVFYGSVNDTLLLIWHETTNQILRGTWPGYAETFQLKFSGAADRITFYGKVTNGSVKTMTEKDGKLTPSTIPLAELPAPVPLPSPPEPSGEPQIDVPVDAPTDVPDVPDVTAEPPPTETYEPTTEPTNEPPAEAAPEPQG